MNIKEVLKQIDLSDKKAEVYLACLELNKATAYLLAKKVNLKRPTVYDILNQLLKEGLVYKNTKGNITYFYPSDPNILLKKLKEKENNINSIMPMLQNLYNSPTPKPFIRYFEGKEGIKEMHEDSLRSLKKGDEILAYVGQDVLEQLPQFADDYVKRRIAKGVFLRGIYKKNSKIMTYMKNNHQQLRNVKLLDEDVFPVNNETNIYKNKIAFANYGKEMFGVLIESAEIAKTQKAIFEMLWKLLPESVLK